MSEGVRDVHSQQQMFTIKIQLIHFFGTDVEHLGGY